MKPKVMTGQEKTIRLSPEDNVMVALNELAPDSIIVEANINSHDRIPAGHKVAISQINSGSPIIKYGQTIGFASKNILPGDHCPYPQCSGVALQGVIMPSVTTPGRRRYGHKKDQATFEGIVRTQWASCHT